MADVCLRIGNLELTGEQLVVALARYQMLEDLVSQVVLDGFLSDAVTLTEQDVRQALNLGEQGDLREKLEEWIQVNQVSFDYLHLVVFRQLRLDRLKQERFDCHVGSEFLRRKSEFDQVEFSLIRVSDSVLAQELYYHIRDDGADFGRLARKYSEGAEKYTQGWMGPLRLSELPPEVQRVVWGQTVGSVQGPILVGTTYWIVRLERVFQARMTMQLRHELREHLFNTWLKARTKAYMSDPQKVEVIRATSKPRTPQENHPDHAPQENNKECA